MSAFHFDRRRLRRTAWATLLVWLFALAAGVVNACMLTPAGATEHAGALVSHADIAMHDPQVDTQAGAGLGSWHDEGGSAAHHGQGQDPGTVSCLKFCDNESSAIAKVKLPVVDLGSSLLAMVEPWYPIAAAGSVGFRQALGRRASHGPPLVIRFLRLTL